MQNTKHADVATIEFDVAATIKAILDHPEALWVIAIIAATVLAWKWLDRRDRG